LQPVSGGQFGTGIEVEMVMLRDAWLVCIGLVVNALAMKPAKTMEKIEACTVSFIIEVTSE
jgi:hypothetical protein